MKGMACHGLDDAGAGLGDMPGLAGLPAEYLTAQLEAFMSGARFSPIMVPIATQLTDEELQAVSDYYASVAPKLSRLDQDAPTEVVQLLSLIHMRRVRRIEEVRSLWCPYL